MIAVQLIEIAISLKALYLHHWQASRKNTLEGQDCLEKETDGTSSQLKGISSGTRNEETGWWLIQYTKYPVSCERKNEIEK